MRLRSATARPTADLAELRRVVGVVAHGARHARLVRLIDQLERDAGWNQVDEIRATRELAAARQERDAALEAAADADQRRREAREELGAAKRRHAELAAKLADLREISPSSLADELVGVAARIEAEHPTSPPLLSLRQAARLVRAVRATAPGRDAHPGARDAAG